MRKWIGMKFKAFVDWMVSEDSWKGMAAIIYLLICLFDFVIMPIYIHASHPDLIELAVALHESNIDLTATVLQASNQMHQPYTLQGGAMFHLAFGAILTGSIIKGKLEPKK